MGSLSEARPLVHDLKVTVHCSSTVFPYSDTERRCIFLSNIDQVLTFDVNTVHFFSANPRFPPDAVGEELQMALGRALVPYDFLAGRLKFNPQEQRLEIDCNAAGVAFLSASSELLLEEVGDLVFPNPAFRQLIAKGEFESLGMEDRPLILFQVTSFKCGGFAIGMANNHTTFDGLSAKMFLENLASLAHGKPLSITPYNNRKILAARSPPRVTCVHPELVKIELLPNGDVKPATIFNAGVDDLTYKVFRLSANNITGLKEKAKAEGASGPAVTSFNVVTAHIWRCKVLATTALPADPNKLSRVLYAIDIRSRMQPPLPRSYTGNAVLTAFGSAKYGELAEGPFAPIVEAVREGATRMTDEYVKSAIDWGQLHKGFPRGDAMISSWWKLGFADVEYPWGRPIYSCPVVIQTSEVIVLLPDKKGMDDNGVNVCVGLPGKKMEEFESLFYEFLP